MNSNTSSFIVSVSAFVVAVFAVGAFMVPVLHQAALMLS
jgi:hypothetical protein